MMKSLNANRDKPKREQKKPKKDAKPNPNK